MSSGSAPATVDEDSGERGIGSRTGLVGTESRAGTSTRAIAAEVLVLVALSAIAVAIRVPTMRQPLLEIHPFRQTQTAFQALEFVRHGIDLLHPRVPVFGTSSDVPFELPLFQAIATVPANLGISLDEALRLTNLAFFMTTAVLLYGVVRRVSGRTAALASFVAFVFCPFGFVWSRTAMIEYLATAGALGFVWSGILWRDERRRRYAAIAVVAGSTAMLVKITTGMFWVLPFVLYIGRDELTGAWAWIRTRLQPHVWTIVAVPVAAGFLWTRYADSVKASSPLTAHLTSRGLMTWNFGTLDQRLELANWSTVGARIVDLALGHWLWIGLVLVGLLEARRLGFWLGWALATLLPIVVFFNLYLEHDYYLAAISPGVAGLVGLGAAKLLERCPKRVAILAGVVLVALWIAPLSWSQSSYVKPLYESYWDPAQAKPYAQELAAVSTSNDRVVIDNFDWNPAILYYADRSGVMLTPWDVHPGLFDRLARSGYHVWLNIDEGDEFIPRLRAWPWVGVQSLHTYRLGRDAADVQQAPFLATTDVDAIPPDANASSSDGRDVVCSHGALTFTPGPQGSWLVPTSTPTRRFRLVINGAAPLPRFPAYAIRAGDPVNLRCVAGHGLTLRVVDAPVP